MTLMDTTNGEVLFVLGVLTAAVVAGILVHRAAFTSRPNKHTVPSRSETAEIAFDSVSVTASNGLSDDSSTATSNDVSDTLSDASFDSGTTND